MNESLMFAIHLRDMVSGGIAKIASTAASVFPGIDKRIATTQKQFSMAGRSVTDLNTHLALLTQRRDMSIGTGDIAKANKEIQLLETRIERMQNMGRANMSGGGGLRLPWWLRGAVIGGMAATGLMAMIKTGADQQRDVVGLSTFMGKDKAVNFYRGVQQDARLTPFVTHDLMAADRMLISTGMNADRARTDIHNLANAVAATGGGNYQLERMAQHLQTIRGLGHASYMYLKEFTTNGINIIQLLNDATGKHISLAHGMTVSYHAIERALAHAAEKGGLFYGALEAQSRTILGKWSTLKDDLIASAYNIVDAQSSAITGLLDLFDKYAQRLPEMAQQWGGAITNIAGHIIGLVAMFIDLAKWVYHNWLWLKYVIGVFVAFKVAIWAATAATAIYNGVISLSAMRMTALAAAEVEASAGAVALDTAMAATPWGAIALGIVAVGVAITALVSSSKNAGNEITKNLNPNLIKPISIAPTQADVNRGNAYYSRSGGYQWKTPDIMDAPLTAAELAKLAEAKRQSQLHPRWAAEYSVSAVMQQIQKDREASRHQSEFVIYKPVAADMAKKSKDFAPDKGDGEGDGIEAGAITGGGGKKQIFNFRNFTEHYTVQVKDASQVAEVTEEKMDEMFMRLLLSARAAM